MRIKNIEQLGRLYSKLRNELGAFVVAVLENPEVLEIIVNSEDSGIWVEEKTKGLYDTGETIAPDKLFAALGTIAAMNDAEINVKKPALSCVLPLDGSRVQGTIPPLSPAGPMLCIRKHASGLFPLSQYIEEGRIEAKYADYLRDMIKRRKNIIVSGGTSSGKTTLGNALIKEMLGISPNDRLLLMEDTKELQCATKNKDSFTTCEGITMRDILKVILRCRPDRIIVGEVRDGAALELLKAWNTGHSGGFATLHADSAWESLIRMEQMILEVTQSPMKELIGSAVDVVVYMKEYGKIGRQVVEILEVTGYKNGEYQCSYIFRHRDLDSGRYLEKTRGGNF